MTVQKEGVCRGEEAHSSQRRRTTHQHITSGCCRRKQHMPYNEADKVNTKEQAALPPCGRSSVVPRLEGVANPSKVPEVRGHGAL